MPTQEVQGRLKKATEEMEGGWGAADRMHGRE